MQTLSWSTDPVGFVDPAVAKRAWKEAKLASIATRRKRQRANSVENRTDDEQKLPCPTLQPSTTPERQDHRRLGLLSASQFGAALGFCGNVADFVFYQRHHVGTELEFTGNDATAHGIHTEPRSKLIYELLTQTCVAPGGFFVDGECGGRLACSPDGIVFWRGLESPRTSPTTARTTRLAASNFNDTPLPSLSRKPQRLLEIKSPFYQLFDGSKSSSQPFGIPLSYMCQMQGQMAIAGASECDFFVCLDKQRVECCLWRVSFSPEFWDWAKPKLLQACFWIEEAQDEEATPERSLCEQDNASRGGGERKAIPAAARKSLHWVNRWSPAFDFSRIGVRPILPPTCLTSSRLLWMRGDALRRYPFFFAAIGARERSSLSSVFHPVLDDGWVRRTSTLASLTSDSAGSSSSLRREATLLVSSDASGDGLATPAAVAHGSTLPGWGLALPATVNTSGDVVDPENSAQGDRCWISTRASWHRTPLLELVCVKRLDAGDVVSVRLAKEPSDECSGAVLLDEVDDDHKILVGVVLGFETEAASDSQRPSFCAIDDAEVQPSHQGPAADSRAGDTHVTTWPSWPPAQKIVIRRVHGDPASSPHRMYIDCLTDDVELVAKAHGQVSHEAWPRGQGDEGPLRLGPVVARCIDPAAIDDGKQGVSVDAFLASTDHLRREFSVVFGGPWRPSSVAGQLAIGCFSPVPSQPPRRVVVAINGWKVFPIVVCHTQPWAARPEGGNSPLDEVIGQFVRSPDNEFVSSVGEDSSDGRCVSEHPSIAVTLLLQLLRVQRRPSHVREVTSARGGVTGCHDGQVLAVHFHIEPSRASALSAQLGVSRDALPHAATAYPNGDDASTSYDVLDVFLGHTPPSVLRSMKPSYGSDSWGCRSDSSVIPSRQLTFVAATVPSPAGCDGGGLSSPRRWSLFSPLDVFVVASVWCPEVEC